MKTASKIVWTAAGVGGVSVLVGVGLMMAGDLMGRRDEAALKAVIAAPVALGSPARAGKTAPDEISQTLDFLEMSAANSPVQASVLEAAEAITVDADGERSVDRQQLLEATHGNPLQLVFSQAKFVPHLEGMRSGLRVAAVADSPWTQKAGLEPGDVLTAVNGKALLDPRKMGEIAKDLFGAPDVAITVQRAGQEMHLQYHMGPPAAALRNSGNP